MARQTYIGRETIRSHLDKGKKYEVRHCYRIDALVIARINVLLTIALISPRERSEASVNLLLRSVRVAACQRSAVKLVGLAALEDRDQAGLVLKDSHVRNRIAVHQ